MTGNDILMAAKTCFTLGNIEYRLKCKNEAEVKRAHKRAYNAAVVRGYFIIRRRGNKGYCFLHSGRFLSIYFLTKYP